MIGRKKRFLCRRLYSRRESLAYSKPLFPYPSCAEKSQRKAELRCNFLISGYTDPTGAAHAHRLKHQAVDLAGLSAPDIAQQRGAGIRLQGIQNLQILRDRVLFKRETVGIGNSGNLTD